MAENQELTMIDKGALASVPAYLAGMQGNTEGFEDVKPGDLVLARLAICQDLTPQHKKNKPNFIDGLEVGQLFNTVSGDIYPEKVKFIPLLKSQSRIYFKDIKEGGGILCRSFNGINGGTISPEGCDRCLNSQWSEDRSKPPKCNEFMNFPILLLPHHEPMVLSFKSTALSAAQNWLTRMQYKSQRFKLPMYVQVWELTTKLQTRGTNEFYGPILAPSKENNGWAEAQEAEYAARQYTFLKTRRVLVHDEDTQEVETEAAPF